MDTYSNMIDPSHRHGHPFLAEAHAAALAAIAEAQRQDAPFNESRLRSYYTLLISVGAEGPTLTPRRLQQAMDEMDRATDRCRRWASSSSQTMHVLTNDPHRTMCQRMLDAWRGVPPDTPMPPEALTGETDSWSGQHWCSERCAGCGVPAVHLRRCSRCQKVGDGAKQPAASPTPFCCLAVPWLSPFHTWPAGAMLPPACAFVQVKYSGAECQRKHWKDHKKECVAVAGKGSHGRSGAGGSSSGAGGASGGNSAVSTSGGSCSST